MGIEDGITDYPEDDGPIGEVETPEARDKREKFLNRLDEMFFGIDAKDREAFITDVSKFAKKWVDENA